MTATMRRREEERPGQRSATAAEIASYIADMTRELERLAAAAALDGLSVLLRRACEEATRTAER